MSKVDYKRRLQQIAQTGLYTNQELAQYFSINEKSLYKIKRGITARPRKPFDEKLITLERSIIGINHPEVNLPDSSSLYSQRQRTTEIRMHYIKALFPALNDESQKSIIQTLYDLTYKTEGTTILDQMKQDLDLF